MRPPTTSLEHSRIPFSESLRGLKFVWVLLSYAVPNVSIEFVDGEVLAR
jgi:hypothetical protein